MVETGQLAVGVKVSANSRLWFDDGSEFVGGVIHSSSMRKVDDSAGRETVTTK